MCYERRSLVRHHVWLSLLAVSLLLIGLSARPVYSGEVRGSRAVQVRFVDSATGFAVNPDEVSAVSRRGRGPDRRADLTPSANSGRAVLNLDAGRHMIEVGAAGYIPMAGEVDADHAEGFVISYVLDPVVPPREVQAGYIEPRRQADATLFLGFVGDEETGRPLRGVKVTSAPSGSTTQTDDRGYFEIYVPVQQDGVASSLAFEKGGYRSQERVNLELWSNGDWIYQVSLKRGVGRDRVDENSFRRRASGSAGSGDSSESESREATVSAASAAHEDEGAESSVSADSASNPVVRVPRTIRVLRQDGVTIDYVSMETYTKRVLPSEWIASWANYGGGSGINSLKAGAVVIRTFAAGYVSNPLSTTYDICGTTSCQAYVHTANNSSANTAVDQTASYLMLPPGAARITFKLTEYSAENNSLGFSCGDGFTQPTGGCIADPVCTGETRFGHGRGMCQWGTVKWATGLKFPGNNFSNTTATNGHPKQDWTWICEHYYPNLELVLGAPLTTNDYVKVLGTSSLTVRECPGGTITNGINCPEITTKPSGATGLIIGGPVHVTTDGRGYTWWRVQWNDAGPTVGWSPESWLERTVQPPTFPPVLAPIADKFVNEGALLTFTNSATAPETSDTPITDFEAFADGTANGTVLFRQPNFSGSTSGFLNSSPNTCQVTGTFPAGNDSSRALRANWSWTSAGNAWLRLTTSGTANVPNPVIDLTRKLVFDIHTDKALKVAVGVRETGNPAGTPIGSDGGTGSSSIEWAGVTNVVSGQPQATRTVSPGTWTTLTFDLPTEPARSFSGGNNVLSTPTGLATLEHLAFAPAGGSGAYDVFLDNFAVSIPKVLTYSISNAPPGASINSTNGVFTWTPTEAQGPGVYNITVRVTDNSSPPLSDGKSFNVTVGEVNQPPALASIGNRTVHAGSTVTVTNSATDSDLPANTLSYSLDAGAPAGASINPNSGVFTWATSDANAGTTNAVTVRVTDNGSPAMSDSKAFVITVLGRPSIQSVVLNGSNLTLTWAAISGTKYRVQYKVNIDGPVWTDLPPDVTASGATASKIDPIGPGQRFYRILVLD